LGRRAAEQAAKRHIDDASLVLEKRKPFDFLAERLDLKNSRGDWHSFEPVTESPGISITATSECVGAFLDLLVEFTDQEARFNDRFAVGTDFPGVRTGD
jgi:hypothetical protein